MRTLRTLLALGAAIGFLAAGLPALADEPEPLLLEAHPVAAGVAPPASFLEPGGTDYRIGRQDLLEITVFDVDELDQTVRVADDGSITMPLLGRLAVAGLTKGELEGLIARLLEERFVRDPQVTVFVKDYESKKVAVTGAVKKPGSFEMLGRKTLLEMISLAGGLDTEMGEDIFIFRRGPDGASERIPIDLERLVYAADPALNLSIEPNDIIYVPTVEKVRIFVTGAVKNPDVYEVPHHEPVTVLKAITLAGGTTDRAAEKKVTVMRDRDDGTRESLSVNLRKIKRGTAEDPILQEGDIVLVPEAFFLMDFLAGGKHLLDYWAILRRRRWIIFLAVGTATLVALIGSYLMTPLYRAGVTLQIERYNPDILNFREMSRSDYSWAAYSDFYETQYRIIASDSVARRVVERLGLASHPDFVPDGDARPGWLARLRGLLPRRAPTRPPDPVEIAAFRVSRSLEVTPVPNSHLVQVAWVGDDPELAADVANAVAGAYIQATIASTYSTTGEAKDFLIDQIANLKREVAALESRLQEYGEVKGIISIDESNNVTMRALQDLAQQRTAARATLARAEAELRAVREADPDALPEVLNSPLISRLREEYAGYEAEFSQKSRQFKDDWPGMQTLRSRLEQSRRRLEMETDQIVRQVRAGAEAAHAQALSEVRNLDALVRDHEQQAQRLKRDAVEFASLESEVEKKRDTLDALIARQNEIALSSRLKDMDATSTNIRIMEPARVPAAPFRPNVKTNVLLGLLGGLVVGVGMALFLHYVDNTVSSPADIEDLVAQPLLAVIPRHAEPGGPVGRGKATAGQPIDLVAHRDGRSGASEAYRDLRTSILLSHAGEPPRQIVVTSALPAEGKTATTLNLGVVLAQMGKRVLLVDTDLRRPRLHKAFGVENRRGVSTWLSGQEKDAAALIVATGIERLDLLTSGPIPPNPSELLNSPMLRELGRTLLDRHYDHLLFDSPPALSVTDPMILANVCDAGVLVTRAGSTPRPSLRLAAARLAQGGCSFGVVLNDLDARAEGAGYYRYRYYGSYGEDGPGSADPDEGPARAGRAGA